MKKLRTVCVVAGLLWLAACATPTEVVVESVASMRPGGSPFTQFLHAGYVAQARLEAAEYDFESAELWADKAKTAALGTAPAPETLAAWPVPATHLAELQGARARLSQALTAGAPNMVPAPMAQAQVSFDCWLEEQSENFQPDDIAACKRDYAAAMTDIEGPPRMTAVPPSVPVAKPQTLMPGPWTVLFGFDSASVDDIGKGIADHVAEGFIDAKPAVVVIQGHTDRAGPSDYNLRLSQRRAGAVRQALIDSGVPAASIRVAEFGETRPVVPTADDVRRAENRRVEIFFE